MIRSCSGVGDQMAQPEHHISGAVEFIPGLVIQAAAGRARSLLLYRATYRGQAVLAIEYAPIAMVQRHANGALVPIASKGDDVAKRLTEAATRWLDLESRAKSSVGSQTGNNGGMAEVVRQPEGLGWSIRPISSAAASLAGHVGSGPEVRVLKESQAASLARALAHDMALNFADQRLHLNISPETVLQIEPSLPTSLIQIVAALPDERGLFEPALYNMGVSRHFAAPELRDASGRIPVGPATDIYSASAVIAFAISGEPPPDFTAGLDVGQWLADHPVAGQHDARFRAAIAAGLARNPKDRPPNAVAWLEGFGIGPEPAQGGMMAHGWAWTGPSREPQPPFHDSAGAFLGGAILAATFSAAAFGLLVALARSALTFAHDGQGMMALAGMIAAISIGFLVHARSGRPSARARGWGGFLTAGALALACIAEAVNLWPEEPSRPGPDPAPVIESPAPDTYETPMPELVDTQAELSGAGVFRLGNGAWVDLEAFTGVFVSKLGTCDATGVATGRVELIDDPEVGKDVAKAVLRAETPGGIVYDLAIAGPSTPVAKVLKWPAAAGLAPAWLTALNQWREKPDLTFEIVRITRSDGQRLNPLYQPEGARLSVQPKGIPTLRFVISDEEDGDVTEDYFGCR